jgi:hypothetical protein
MGKAGREIRLWRDVRDEVWGFGFGFGFGLWLWGLTDVGLVLSLGFF